MPERTRELLARAKQGRLDASDGYELTGVFHYLYDEVQACHKADREAATLKQALGQLLAHIEAQACSHEHVHSLGDQRLVCVDCAANGHEEAPGVRVFEVPEPVRRARDTLARLTAEH